MKNIKTKNQNPKSIKKIDKAIAWTERVKDPVVYINEKSKDATDDKVDVVDYGEDKVKYISNRLKDETKYASKSSIKHAKDFFTHGRKNQKNIKFRNVNNINQSKNELKKVNKKNKRINKNK